MGRARLTPDTASRIDKKPKGIRVLWKRGDGAHGELRHWWQYGDKGFVVRYDYPDGSKETIPYFRYEDDKWKPGGPETSSPLFGLETIQDVPPDTAVFVTEGEKSAAALHQLGLPAVTSQGGCKAANKADWAPLGRFLRIVILPDNDEPGEKYAQSVVAKVAAVASVAGVAGVASAENKTEILLARLPKLPKGGDVVDWLQARVPEWDGYAPIAREPGDGLTEELLEAIEAVLEPAEMPSADTAGDWPAPMPLPTASNPDAVSEFPLELLPPRLRDAALEVARFAKVPEVSPSLIGTSVIAAAIGKKAVVEERNGLIHHPSLFLSLIAPSGERKSPPFKYMTYPLEEWTRQQQDKFEQETADAKSKNIAIDSKIADLKSKAKNKLSIEDATRQIGELEIQRLRPPANPRPFTTDATEQRLFQQLHDHDGAYAVLSGEGRPVFDAIMGKYSGKGNTGDAIYLAGITGDTITRDRVGEAGRHEERVIYCPCLNVCVCVQPDKYLEAARNHSLRQSGALARIWPVWLPSLVGTRIEAENEAGLDPSKMKQFNDLIFDLLDRPLHDSPHIARLSPDAARARRILHNKVERLMADGGDFEDVRDIAAKAVSQITKLALVFHIARRPDVLFDMQSEISPATWSAAETIGMYHLHEAVRVQRVADGDVIMDMARRAVQWITEKRVQSFTVRELQQSMPRPRPDTAAQAAEACDALVDFGYCRRENDPKRRKPIFTVNPNVIANTDRMSTPS